MSQVSQDHEIYVALLKKYTKVFGVFFFKPKCLHLIVVWGFTVEADSDCSFKLMHNHKGEKLPNMKALL